MRQQRLVRRHAVEHARRKQRRMEPAAVLVGAFEIEVGRKAGPIRMRAAMLAAAIGPAHAPSGAWLRSRTRRRGCPRACDTSWGRRRNPRSVALCHASMPPRSTFAAASSSSGSVSGCSISVSRSTKNGSGTPHCRCRDNVQSGRLAIIPCSRALPQAGKNCVASMPRQRGFAQRLCRLDAVPPGDVVHAGEPLRRRAIDDRRLVPPAMHVAVGDFSACSSAPTSRSFSTISGLAFQMLRPPKNGSVSA